MLCFQVTDPNGNRIVMESNGARHLIEPEILINNGKDTAQLDNFNLINFTINFGYENTGCAFASNEPEMVVDPPPGWLDGRDSMFYLTSCLSVKTLLLFKSNFRSTFSDKPVMRKTI